MNRNRQAGSARFSGCIGKAMAAMVLAGLVACGDGRNLPGPPQGPPRPVTSEASLNTAQFILPSRPVTPPPGMM